MLCERRLLSAASITARLASVYAQAARREQERLFALIYINPPLLATRGTLGG
jgi:hypothetical protein